jgi:transcriptional regulator with XRE-family HTH domain
MAQIIDKKTNPVAYRLRELRTRLGHRKMAFAKLLNVAPSRWSNVEHGSPLSRDMADRLKKTIPGLDLDYIYDGDEGDLSNELVLLLAGVTDRSRLGSLPLGEHFGKLLMNNKNSNDKPEDYATTRKRRRG